MPATDWIETLRAAVWAAIDADEDLSTSNASGVMYKGTKVKFEAGLMERLQPEPAMCPILAMAPRGPIGQPMGQRGEREGRRCVLAFDLYGKGPGTSEVTALFAELVSVLQASLPTFGIEDDYPTKVETSDAKLEAAGDIKDPYLMFAISFDLVVAYRVGT